MLNLEICEKVLKQNGLNLTKEEIKQLRDFLYRLAMIEYENSKNMTNDKRSVIHQSINRGTG